MDVIATTAPVERKSTAELSYPDLRAMAALLTAVDRNATAAWMVGDTTVVATLNAIAMRRGGDVINRYNTPSVYEDIVADGWVHMSIRENGQGPEMPMSRSVSDLLYSLQSGSFVIDPNLSHLA